MKRIRNIIGIILFSLLFSGCFNSSINEEVDAEVDPNVGKPIPIEDPNCKGDNYQVTWKDGETLKYCLPADAITAEQLVEKFNEFAQMSETNIIDTYNPDNLYGEAIDVYEDIAVKVSTYPASKKIDNAFIFAESIYSFEREEELKSVLYNLIMAFNPSLDEMDAIHVIDRLFAEGTGLQTHVSFDYENNFFRLEIDSSGAYGITIRSNEFDGAK